MTGPLLVIGVCNLLLAWMLWLTFKGHERKHEQDYHDGIDAAKNRLRRLP